MQRFAVAVGIDLQEEARIVLGFESPEVVLQQIRPTQEIAEAGIVHAFARNAVFPDLQPNIEVSVPLLLPELELADGGAEGMREIENRARRHGARRKDQNRLDRWLRGNKTLGIRPMINGAHAKSITALNRVMIPEESEHPMRRQ